MSEKIPYQKIRALSIPESLMPVKSVPDLLIENRAVAMELASELLRPMAALAQLFGVPMMDLIFESIPEEADTENLETDGVREAAAAKTYLDLKGAVSLSDICKGMHASRAPTLRLVAQEFARRSNACCQDVETDEADLEPETDEAQEGAGDEQED